MISWLPPVLAGSFIILFFPIAALQWLALTMIITIIFSYLYVRLLRKSLTVQRLDLSPRTFRLTPMSIRIHIFNPLPFRVPSVLIADDAGGMSVIGDQIGVYTLPSQGSAELSYRVKSERRGRYRIGPGEIFFCDPLGLFPTRMITGKELDLLVLPRVYPLEYLLRQGLPLGEISIQNRMYEDPGRYRSLREYVSGDDPRRIHWKASAKTGILQVMEYSSTMSAPVTIILNVSAGIFQGNTQYRNFERIIEAGASACRHWEELNQEYRLVISGSGMIFPRARNQTAGILEYLAGLDGPVDGDGSDAQTLISNLSFTQGERVILISPPIPEKEYVSIASLLPQGSPFDYWCLEDRVHRENFVTPRYRPAFSRMSIFGIREYGEEMFE